MNKNYKTSIFIVCFFAIYHMVISLFSSLNSYVNHASSFGTFFLLGIVFVAGYLYARTFNEQLSLKKSFLIVAITRLLNMSFNLLQDPSLLASYYKNSFEQFTIITLLVWFIYSGLQACFFVWGNSCLFTKSLIDTNPWLLGLRMLMISLFVNLPLVLIFSLIDPTFNTLPSLGLIIILVFLLMFPLTGIYYVRIYNRVISFKDAMKASIVYGLIIQIPLLTSNMLSYSHNNSLEVAEKLGSIFGFIIGNLFFSIPLAFIFAVVLKQSGKIYLYSRSEKMLTMPN